MPDAKQLKFYRYLVVYPELGVVYPAKTKIEADEMVGEQSAQEAFIVDARWDSINSAIHIVYIDMSDPWRSILTKRILEKNRS